jgi:hypothetical protein
MKNFKLEAAIIAVGLIVLGGCICSGLRSLAERDRTVTVKGLAEMEVPANKVTWPLMYKLVGNDLNAPSKASSASRIATKIRHISSESA